MFNINKFFIFLTALLSMTYGLNSFAFGEKSVEKETPKAATKSTDEINACAASLGNRSDMSFTTAIPYCRDNSESVITCAKNLGNRGDMDFKSAIPYCQAYDNSIISCAASLGDRSDMFFTTAIPYCRDNSESVITCAKNLGNRGDMNFKSAIPYCQNIDPEKGRRDELNSLVSQGLVNEQLYSYLVNQKKKSHAEAIQLAQGPYFMGIEAMSQFLNELAKHVYSADSTYFKSIAKLVEEQKSSVQEKLFITAALLPYLENFPYTGVKEKYLSDSIANINQVLADRNISSLDQLESKVNTKLALLMLANSLQASLGMVDAANKPAITNAISWLSTVLAGPLKNADIIEFQKNIPSLEKILLMQAQNPYIAQRNLTDMKILSYLRSL